MTVSSLKVSPAGLSEDECLVPDQASYLIVAYQLKTWVLGLSLAWTLKSLILEALTTSYGSWVMIRASEMEVR